MPPNLQELLLSNSHETLSFIPSTPFHPPIYLPIHPFIHLSVRHLWHLSFITHGLFGIHQRVRYLIVYWHADKSSQCSSNNSRSYSRDLLSSPFKHNTTFTFSSGNTISSRNPSSSYSRVITQFLNILFFPLVHYFVHTESQGETNKVLSHVFFLLIKTIKYSENRSPELWPAINSLQAAPSWASEVYFRCCHMGLMQGKSTPKTC